MSVVDTGGVGGWKIGRIAILIPCFNEEITIGDVVRSFRAQVPDADIYVYDNNSSDRTAEMARAAGAVVCRERFQGKGNVVRRMFADVEADTYILVDGDGTYNAASPPPLLQAYAEPRGATVNPATLTTTQAAFPPALPL